MAPKHEQYGEQQGIPIPSEAAIKCGTPACYKVATLHPKVLHRYDAEIREVALEYVARWEEAGRAGYGVVLVGDSGVGKSYAASAIGHEIIMQYYPRHQFSLEFFSAAGDMRMLLDDRHFRRKEQYFHNRNRLFRSDLLILDDVGFVSAYPEAKEMLFAALDERYKAQRPTVITFNGTSLDELKDVFNKALVRRLRQRSKGSIVTITSEG